MYQALEAITNGANGVFSAPAGRARGTLRHGAPQARRGRAARERPAAAPLAGRAQLRAAPARARAGRAAGSRPSCAAAAGAAVLEKSLLRRRLRQARSQSPPQPQALRQRRAHRARARAALPPGPLARRAARSAAPCAAGPRWTRAPGPTAAMRAQHGARAPPRAARPSAAELGASRPRLRPSYVFRVNESAARAFRERRAGPRAHPGCACTPAAAPARAPSAPAGRAAWRLRTGA